jgi:hypothetical protein
MGEAQPAGRSLHCCGETPFKGGLKKREQELKRHRRTQSRGVVSEQKTSRS